MKVTFYLNSYMKICTWKSRLGWKNTHEATSSYEQHLLWCSGASWGSPSIICVSGVCLSCSAGRWLTETREQPDKREEESHPRHIIHKTATSARSLTLSLSLWHTHTHKQILFVSFSSMWVTVCTCLCCSRCCCQRDKRPQRRLMFRHQLISKLLINRATLL